MRGPYLTDLSDAEWTYLKDHFPTPKATGRPRLHTLREILDAIFYVVVRSGYAWWSAPIPPDHCRSQLLLKKAVELRPREGEVIHAGKEL
jgi:transposase